MQTTDLEFATTILPRGAQWLSGRVGWLIDS